MNIKLKNLTLTALLLLTTSAYAQIPPAAEIMRRADKNMDGAITRAEAEDTPMKDFFGMFDLNNDGNITLAELKMALGEPADAPAAVLATPAPAATAATPPAVILSEAPIFASDGKPDLSGVWVAVTDVSLASVLRKLPLTTQAKNKLATAAKIIPRKNGAATETAASYCLGDAMPAITLLTGGSRMEILQRPERITINTELDGQTRRLFLKNKVDVDGEVNSRLGYSTADWAGDTLVVKTAALSESLPGDEVLPHGENAKVLESYRLTRDAAGNKTLRLDLTLTDPAYYSKPVKFSQKYQAISSRYMQNFDCLRWDMRLETLRAEFKAGPAASTVAK